VTGDGDRRVISLIASGGTISALGRGPVDPWYYETGDRVTAEEMRGWLDGSGENVELRTVPCPLMSSQEMTDRSWLSLWSLATSECRRSAGIVITHGTNTLEETAFFLDATLGNGGPVVLTGAMRPASSISPDGPLSLLNAVRVAASREAQDRGVLVVSNDQVFRAPFVTKTHMQRVDAFTATHGGPIGAITPDGRVHFYHQATGPTPLPRPNLASVSALPKVDVVLSYVGNSGYAVDAAIGAGARGLISAGTGSGYPTPDEVEALKRASRQGIVICQASRVQSGTVLPNPAIRRSGFVAAGRLGPLQARILLSLGLLKTNDIETIQSWFDAY
jgi:L-asparaginase